MNNSDTSNLYVKFLKFGQSLRPRTNNYVKITDPSKKIEIPDDAYGYVFCRGRDGQQDKETCSGITYLAAVDESGLPKHRFAESKIKNWESNTISFSERSALINKMEKCDAQYAFRIMDNNKGKNHFFVLDKKDRVVSRKTQYVDIPEELFVIEPTKQKPSLGTHTERIKPTDRLIANSR